MEKVILEYIAVDDCAKKIRAIDDTMDILSGKWKVSIIARLCYKPFRYSELLKDLHGISGKMLSSELKELQVNGLITREVATTQPLAVTYAISNYGISLKNLTDCIADWGLEHRKRVVGQ